MIRLPSIKNPVPEARRGMSRIHGAAKFGSTYSVKIWTTDFSGSEPSGSGVPCGGAAELDVVGGTAEGVWGAMTAGSGFVGLGAPPGTVGVGTDGATPGIDEPEGGVTVVEVAAVSGNPANTKPN